MYMNQLVGTDALQDGRRVLPLSGPREIKVYIERVLNLEYHQTWLLTSLLPSKRFRFGWGDLTRGEFRLMMASFSILSLVS